MQLQGDVLGVGKALHRGTGEYLFEQRSALESHAVQCRGVLALQVNSHRAGRAADTAEQIPLDGEDPRVRQTHHDLVAHQPLQLPDAALIHDPGADGAATGPGEDVPVLQSRLLSTLHVRSHPFEDGRDQLAIDRLGAHAGRKIEECVDGRALHGRQVIKRRQHPPREQQRDQQQARDPRQLFGARVGHPQHPLGEARPARTVAAGTQRAVQREAQRHGQQRQRSHDRDRHRDRDGEGEVPEQLTLDVLEKQHRHEHRDGGGGGGKQRSGDLSSALAGRLFQGHTALAQANDVSRDHDRALDHHAHREREPGEGDDVQTAAEQIERNERGAQTHRDGGRDQQRDAPFAHEPPDHDQCEQGSDEQVLGQQPHGAANEQRRIEGLLDPEPVGLECSRAQLRDRGFHRIERRQHVGAVGPEYLNADGRVAVLVAEELACRRSDIDGGDVRQAHGPAVAPRQHQRAELLGREAAGETQRVLTPPDIELTTGHVGGAGGAVGHIGNNDSEGGGARQVERDAHVVGRTRVDLDGRDARYRLEPRAHRILDEASLRLDRTRGPGKQLHEEPGQGLVGIAVTPERHAGAIGIARQRRQTIDAPDHLHERVFHVRSEREAQVHLSLPGEGVAFDFLYARHPLHDVFQGLEELRLDLLGRGRAPTSLDGQFRSVDVREQLQRQAAQAQKPEETQEHRDDDHPDRTAARPVQAVHGFRPTRSQGTPPGKLGCYRRLRGLSGRPRRSVRALRQGVGGYVPALPRSIDRELAVSAVGCRIDARVGLQL